MILMSIIGLEIRDYVNGGLKDILFAISGSELFEVELRKQPNSISEMMTKTIYRSIDLSCLELSQSQCR
jgi:hypothetical protein